MANPQGVSAKVRGEDLARIRAKMLGLLGPEAKAATRKSNALSAKEFEALVRQIVPRGPEERGHLVDTLRSWSVGETGVAVGIGNRGGGKPYPLHLEAGHRNKDGSHTPATPFWFPAKRVLKKKHNNRALRAERAAIKTIMGQTK